MAIPVDGLRDRLARTIGAGGPSFDIHVLGALNSVITDFNRQCNREVEYLESISGSLDLSMVHYNVFYFGGLFYLETSGEWAKEPSQKTAAMYERALAMSQFEAINVDDPDAGIPAGTWKNGLNQFDPSGLTDIDSETGTPSGGEGI